MSGVPGNCHRSPVPHTLTKTGWSAGGNQTLTEWPLGEGWALFPRRKPTDQQPSPNFKGGEG